MDLPTRDVSDDDDEQEMNQSSDTGKRLRHSPNQILRLQETFNVLPRPDKKQRLELANELGLEPKQSLHEKAVNSALRAENEKILNEIMEMKEAMKNIFCQSCKPNVEHEQCLNRLRLENALLKEKYERLIKFVPIEKEKLSLELKKEPPTKTSPLGDFLKLGVSESGSLNLIVGSSSKSSLGSQENVLSKKPSNGIEMETSRMLEVGIAAKDELLKLLRTNEPFWVKSQVDRRLVLHQQNYENIFSRVDHFDGADVRIESSKDSRIVKFKALDLIDMFLDSEKWTNLFPIIVSKGETIKVLESGSPKNRNGALLLMHGEMHVLSPLVPCREFYFLRFCAQVEANIWVIADVSYDYLKENGPHSSTWRFPSGCIIHQISSGTSQVSWIEHVEVGANVEVHSIYRDIVNGAIAFGASRWLMELQRMGERLTRASLESIASYDKGEIFSVITSPEGRRRVMQLANEVVKDFSQILAMSSKLDNIPKYFIDADDSGVRFCLRNNTNSSIVIVASSISLPIPSHIVFNFLKDPARRFQWDVICNGKPWQEVAHISTGTHPNNYVSIIEPMEPRCEDSVVIMQECFIEPLGSYVVFSPVNVPQLKMFLDGHDSSMVSLIPSGFFISEESHSLLNDETTSSGSNGNGGVKTRGSLLTVALQILMHGEIMSLESVADASNTLITTTLNNIKRALLFDSQI
ncbi:homeobox-leucine zipper protein HDG11-like [Cicer arietinum]|uniref:homeobox-leucine zipper protein HDG11-like n=1 Tax=Cicer arietinum TaxID=3827 RepID=UPI003CC50B95